MARIVLDQVSKRYPDGALAVDGFDLDVADGELVVLVGPSGCGKSTLLNMVAGLESVTAGTIAIDGEVVNERAPKDRDIAMVFQSYALYPHMTVRENLAFPLELAGLDAGAIRRKIDEAAAMLELTRHLDRRPAHLSGGQRQRVAMGRAIVRRPRAFLMDEPLSNLDARLRVQMRREIARIQKTVGTTTLYVTHDQTEALTLGDRVVVMRRGVAQQVGPPRSLYEAPANLFVAGFIGTPAMNFVSATVAGEALRGPLGTVRLPGRLREAARAGGRTGDVILGIRPEHLGTATPAGDRPGGRVEAVVEAVESTGADVLVYFAVRGAHSPELEELLADAGATEPAGEDVQLIARLDAGANVAAGEPIELRYDPERMHIFDASSGASLTG
ncbi:MAG: ABC transporter ATP-binding protein [Longimicrobiales bacterium]